MKRITLTLVALVLIAAPALAFGFDPVIENGSDIWHTRPNGTSVVKFEADPLPRDFFCTGSQPFAGSIVMGGVPIDTVPVGVLGATDTIVQRLDNAVFDDTGVATTRLQVSAIHLRSVQPFRTTCGAFQIDVTLADGEQPIGEMRIVRQGLGFGYYEADVSLDVRIAFSPVDRDGPTLEALRHIDFPTNKNFWTSQPGEEGVRYNGFVMVDTDSDGGADTFVPGTSRNFAPGWVDRRDPNRILRKGLGLSTDLGVAGALKDASGAIPVGPFVTPVSDSSGLRNVEGAIVANCPVYYATSSSCHCEYDGNHCQEVVLY